MIHSYLLLFLELLWRFVVSDAWSIISSQEKTLGAQHFQHAKLRVVINGVLSRPIGAQQTPWAVEPKNMTYTISFHKSSLFHCVIVTAVFNFMKYLGCTAEIKGKTQSRLTTFLVVLAFSKQGKSSKTK